MKKDKGVSVHIMKAYGVSEGMASLILNPVTGWRRLASLTPSCFTPGKEFPVPIKWKAEWVPEWVSKLSGKHRHFAPAGIRIPDFPVRSLEVRQVRVFRKIFSFYLQGKKAVLP